MTNRIPFRQHRNDLYADLRCQCPTNSGLRHVVKLIGYSDAYFFDHVNAAPQDRTCRCGRPYRVQWFRDGVEAEWTAPYSYKIGEPAQ